MKKAILLVTFGSSVLEAWVSFENIEARVKNAFPGVPVSWSYTSRILRHRMDTEGVKLLSIEEALSRLLRDGYSHVAVQSLHTIAGKEFAKLRRSVASFAEHGGFFTEIGVGKPLLSAAEDIERVAEALIKYIPPERKHNEAVLFMGHGTQRHGGGWVYGELIRELQEKDPLIFMGLTKGKPLIGEVIDQLFRYGVTKTYLMPFMSVAGEHVRNDMVGPHDASWYHILRDVGIECVPIIRGTAEYDEIVDIWVDHLREVMNSMN